MGCTAFDRHHHWVVTFEWVNRAGQRFRVEDCRRPMFRRWRRAVVMSMMMTLMTLQYYVEMRRVLCDGWWTMPQFDAVEMQ